MESMFLQLVGMNIKAGYVILVIIVIRLLLRKAPRIFSYLLWSAVLFRLIVPFSFQNVFSLMPARTQTISKELVTTEGFSPFVQTASIPQQPDAEMIGNTMQSVQPATLQGGGIDPLSQWAAVGAAVWLTGVALLLIYSIFSVVALRRKLRCADRFADHIFELEGLRTPFVFGTLHPCIYLPKGIAPKELSYILKHEQTHIRRWDHLIKPFSFLVLSVHWFNPLAWAAFFLMCEDMELSCDESVLKQMGEDIKKDYSKTLLSFSAGKRIFGGCPLAFGEDNVKGRIKNILNYRKPALVGVIAAVLVVTTACVGLVSDPQGEILSVEDYAVKFVQDQINYYDNAKYSNFRIVDSKITTLELADKFDEMLNEPLEIWRLEYRLKPDDPEKVILAGGMNMIDGWLTEESSMGKPLLIFSYENSRPRYLGCIYTAEGFNGDADTVSGRETMLRTFLEEQGLLPCETYSGDHIIVQFPLSTGETCKLLLSQPVDKGSAGIWCVERWMDGNGRVYYDTPETSGRALDHYKELQKQCDRGQSPWLLNPPEVALRYINDVLGQHLTPDKLKFQRGAGIKDFQETPESFYVGYLSNLKGREDNSGRFSFHLDTVEWLTLEDTARLKELNVDPADLSDGVYIYNPTSYPMYFQGTDKTQIRIVYGDAGMGQRDVSCEEFTKYLEEQHSYMPLYRIVTKDGYVTSMEEQYLP